MNKERISLSEGLILAAIPFLGYLVVFAFEIGFAIHFNMPFEFISPNLSSIFFATLLLSLLGINFFIAGHLFTVIFGPIKDGPIIRAFRRVCPNFVLLVVCAVFWAGEWREYKWFMCGFVLVTFFEFVWPLLIQKNIKGFSAKIEAQEQLEERVVPHFNQFFNWIDDCFGRSFVSAFLIVSLILGIAFSAGFSVSKKRERFLMVYGEDCKVVLRIYGDNAVCVGLNKEKKQTDQNFEIIKLSDAGKHFGFENIGRLTAKE